VSHTAVAFAEGLPSAGGVSRPGSRRGVRSQPGKQSLRNTCSTPTTPRQRVPARPPRRPADSASTGALSLNWRRSKRFTRPALRSATRVIRRFTGCLQGLLARAGAPNRAGTAAADPLWPNAAGVNSGAAARAAAHWQFAHSFL